MSVAFHSDQNSRPDCPQSAGEAHLPFQLHWSLEYWQRETRQRSTSGSREANVGVSMFTSPLTSPPPGWNSDEVRRRGSSYIMFPCAPGSAPCRCPGIVSSILGWIRWVTASLCRSYIRRCWQLSVKGKLNQSGSDSSPAAGQCALRHTQPTGVWCVQGFKWSSAMWDSPFKNEGWVAFTCYLLV